jgi:zinc D-Ala-D-Ala dipeptidase
MKQSFFTLFAFVLMLLACSSDVENSISNQKSLIAALQVNSHPKNEDTLKTEKEIIDSALLNTLKSHNLVDIQQINPSIKIDLKYASTDNFMKKQLYFNISKVYLQVDIAWRLSEVQNYLKSIDSSLSLLVYDGVRPLSVQEAMWKALDTIPVAQRTKFVSNPKNGSIHNYGAAIDLTICDKNGIPLDMGAGYDDIREIAYPKYEARFLASGELTSTHIKNRQLLRKVMTKQGFRNIETEWWHFNACSREQAKEKYKMLYEFR